jgi:hypothetical protein
MLTYAAGKSSNENWAARCVSKYLVDTLRVPEVCSKLSSKFSTGLRDACPRLCINIIYIYMYMYINIYIYTYIHITLTHTHKHTHTHTQTSVVLTTCDADTYFHNNH